MPTPRCNAPWTSAVVEYDGTVRPCFPMRPYGNLLELGSLVAAVNNEDAVAWRRTLDVRIDDTCQGCVCQAEITNETAHQWARHRDEPALAQLVRTTPPS